MGMPGPPHPDPGPDDPRDDLSSLRALLALSAQMTESGDEEQILDLMATSVPGLARCRVACMHLVDGGWQGHGSYRSSEGRVALLTQLSRLDRAGGSVAIPGADWAWAFALPGVRGASGHLVVTADAEPSQSERFLIGVLAHQAGVTLVNARLHRPRFVIGARAVPSRARPGRARALRWGEGVRKGPGLAPAWAGSGSGSCRGS